MRTKGLSPIYFVAIGLLVLLLVGLIINTIGIGIVYARVEDRWEDTGTETIATTITATTPTTTTTTTTTTATTMTTTTTVRPRVSGKLTLELLDKDGNVVVTRQTLLSILYKSKEVVKYRVKLEYSLANIKNPIVNLQVLVKLMSEDGKINKTISMMQENKYYKMAGIIKLEDNLKANIPTNFTGILRFSMLIRVYEKTGEYPQLVFLRYVVQDFKVEYRRIIVKKPTLVIYWKVKSYEIQLKDAKLLDYDTERKIVIFMLKIDFDSNKTIIRVLKKHYTDVSLYSGMWAVRKSDNEAWLEYALSWVRIPKLNKSKIYHNDIGAPVPVPYGEERWVKFKVRYPNDIILFAVFECKNEKEGYTFYYITGTRFEVWFWFDKGGVRIFP